MAKDEASAYAGGRTSDSLKGRLRRDVQHAFGTPVEEISRPFKVPQPKPMPFEGTAGFDVVPQRSAGSPGSAGGPPADRAVSGGTQMRNMPQDVPYVS